MGSVNGKQFGFLFGSKTDQLLTGRERKGVLFPGRVVETSGVDVCL